MSDYEGDGWNPVELSRPKEPARTIQQPDTINDLSRSRRVPDSAARGLSTSKKGKQTLKPRPAELFHPLVQNIRPRAHHGTGGRPVDRPFSCAVRDIDLEAMKLFEESPEVPSDVYELDIAWRRLLLAIPNTTENSSFQIARNNLDIISDYSEAFIKTPGPNSPRIELWGTKEQCQKAKDRLKSWEQHLRSTGQRPSQKSWSKDNAYDGRKEERKRYIKMQEADFEAIRDANDSQFEFEAYLVWPQDYNLEAYILKYDSGILQEIGKKFSCRFRHERNIPRVTRVQAITQSDMLGAYQRLINLAKEMIAIRSRGTHGNFCSLPSSKTYRDQVVVTKIGDAENSPHQITLSGNVLPANESDEWPTSVKLYQKQNRTELRSSIDCFLKALYISQCHVRLRVSFGELFLREFATSKNTGMTFAFDEFLQMMQGRRTQFYDPDLLRSSSDSATFIDKLSDMKQLQYPVEGYRQVFEFKGSDITNRLRLEIEMQPGYDADEPQVCSQRWLTSKTYGQNENILGLRVFDFEKPGYIIRADSYELFTNDSLITDMQAFRSAVSFRPAAGGIKAFPRLNSSFPNHERLVSVTEYTSVKYQYKDTDGIFELRREDLFMQNNGRLNKLADSTRFEVLYYYPEWDNLLGEISNNGPGEDITWRRDLTTFFPDFVDPDHPRSLPHGFKTFMKELQEIQRLLKEVLAE